MNSKKIIKCISFLTIFTLFVSCEKEEGFRWDESRWQLEEFKPINKGKKSSYFKIDDKIISFAVPYLVGTHVVEVPKEDWLSYPTWLIKLVMSKGTDVSKLSPIISLAPGATIKRIDWVNNGLNVTTIANYKDTIDIGSINFKDQVTFYVTSSEGKSVLYRCVAIAIGYK